MDDGKTYDDERVRNACDDIEALLEREGQVAEHTAHHVDEHEHQGYADDFLVLVDLVVLWSAMGVSVGDRAISNSVHAYRSPQDNNTVLIIPNNVTGAVIPLLNAGYNDILVKC